MLLKNISFIANKKLFRRNSLRAFLCFYDFFSSQMIFFCLRFSLIIQSINEMKRTLIEFDEGRKLKFLHQRSMLEKHETQFFDNKFSVFFCQRNKVLRKNRKRLKPAQNQCCVMCSCSFNHPFQLVQVFAIFPSSARSRDKMKLYSERVHTIATTSWEKPLFCTQFRKFIFFSSTNSGKKTCHTHLITVI